VAANAQYGFPERTTLSRADRGVVRAIAEAMFSGEHLSERRLDEHVQAIDVYVSAASRSLRFGLRILLALIRFAPMLLGLRLRTLERLSVEERVIVLDRLERSRAFTLSLAFVGWRTVMTILFYEDPRELAAIGYTEARTRRALPLAVPIPAESGVRLGDGHDLQPVATTPSETGSSREVA
jgi:hypothetical protein